MLLSVVSVGKPRCACKALRSYKYLVWQYGRFLMCTWRMKNKKRLLGTWHEQKLVAYLIMSNICVFLLLAWNCACAHSFTCRLTLTTGCYLPHSCTDLSSIIQYKIPGAISVYLYQSKICIVTPNRQRSNLFNFYFKRKQENLTFSEIFFTFSVS